MFVDHHIVVIIIMIIKLLHEVGLTCMFGTCNQDELIIKG